MSHPVGVLGTEYRSPGGASALNWAIFPAVFCFLKEALSLYRSPGWPVNCYKNQAGFKAGWILPPLTPKIQNYRRAQPCQSPFKTASRSPGWTSPHCVAEDNPELLLPGTENTGVLHHAGLGGLVPGFCSCLIPNCSISD